MVERTLPSPDKYASCPNTGAILDYYRGHFDSVFILLHPFLRPSKIEIERFCPATWPGKLEIIDGCGAVLWQEVLELTGLKSWSDLDVGLRTSIGALNKNFENQSAADQLVQLIEDQGLIPPTEGQLPPLLENRIFEAIKSLGYQWLWLGDQLCTKRELFWIDDLMGQDLVPLHGNVFTPEHDLLLTTHWDSHCSFLCSSRSNIEQILAFDGFEGFYCTERTDVFWGLWEA